MAAASAQASQKHPEITISGLDPDTATAPQLQRLLAARGIQAASIRVNKGGEEGQTPARCEALVRLSSQEDLKKALEKNALAFFLGGRKLQVDRSTNLRSQNMTVSDPDCLSSMAIKACWLGVYLPDRNVFLQRCCLPLSESRPPGKLTVNSQRGVVHLCFSCQRRDGAHIQDYKVRFHIRDLVQVIEVPHGQVVRDRPHAQDAGFVFRFQCAPEVYQQMRQQTEKKQRYIWVRGDMDEEVHGPRTTAPFFRPLSQTWGPNRDAAGQYFDYLVVPTQAGHRRGSELVTRLLKCPEWGQGQAEGMFLVRFTATRPIAKKLFPASKADDRRRLEEKVPFPVLFQLEKMVGERLVFKELLSKEFYRLLAVDEGSDDDRAAEELRICRALEHFRVKSTILERPAEQLAEALALVDKNEDDGRFVDDPQETQNSVDLVPVLRVTVTPLTRRCWGPELDMPNRILRAFKDKGDRFMRVHFTDENWERLAVGSARYPMFDLVKRVKEKLGQGIVIGSRRYEFLAMSNSQLREHCCWFFASDGTTSADDIRRWMGDFNDIKIVAKYAARMGQSFSSTITSSSLEVGPAELEEIPDIKDDSGKFVFSDGIGTISREVRDLDKERSLRKRQG